EVVRVTCVRQSIHRRADIDWLLPQRPLRANNMRVGGEHLFKEERVVELIGIDETKELVEIVAADLNRRSGQQDQVARRLAQQPAETIVSRRRIAQVVGLIDDDVVEDGELFSRGMLIEDSREARP